MTIEEFAKKCGCVVVEVGPGWGGKFGWHDKDDPDCTICGYRTADAAYRGFMKETFGKTAGSAVARLIKDLNTLKAATP